MSAGGPRCRAGTAKTSPTTLQLHGDETIVDIVVTVTTRTGGLEVTLQAPDPGAELGSAMLVIFPEDPKKWVPRAGEYSTVAPGINACSKSFPVRCGHSGLLPGRYLVAVVRSDGLPEDPTVPRSAPGPAAVCCTY